MRQLTKDRPPGPCGDFNSLESRFSNTFGDPKRATTPSSFSKDSCPTSPGRTIDRDGSSGRGGVKYDYYFSNDFESSDEEWAGVIVGSHRVLRYSMNTQNSNYLSAVAAESLYKGYGESYVFSIGLLYSEGASQSGPPKRGSSGLGRFD